MYREFRNTFIFGEPGTGKSKVLRYYIEEVIDDRTDESDVVLIAHRPLPYHSSKIRDHILSNYDEKIKELHAEYLQRRENPNIRELPVLYIFIDGLRKTYEKLSEEARVMLGDLMEYGPRARVYCVIASSSKEYPAPILAGSAIIELK